jgi:ABC-type transport system involved in multi-copper enzyme maturation permease subunit
MPQLSFSGALRSELTRFVSLRSTWVFLGITAVLFPIGAAFLSAVMRFASTIGPDGKPATTPAAIPGTVYWQSITTTGGTCAVLFAIFAALALTAEYSNSSIQTVFVANPRRMSVFWSKAIVAAALSMVASLVGIFVAWAVVAIVLAPAKLSPMENWQNSRMILMTFLGVALSMAAFAAMGVGIAALIRSTALSILAIFGLTYVLPLGISILASVGTNLSWLESVDSVMPTEAYSAFLRAGIEAYGSPGWVPDWWQAGLILAAWAVALSVAGSFVMRKVDIK